MQRTVLSLGLALALALPVSGAAQAGQGAAAPSIGPLAIAGTGCPPGTASQAISDDGSIVVIVFEDWTTETGDQPFARETCNLAIPVSVPEGMSVALLPFFVFGHQSLPAGATAQFQAELFAAGGTGPIHTTELVGPASGRFWLHTAVPQAEQVWSPCGTSPNLRANLSVIVQSAPGETASVAIDAAVSFRLVSRAC